MLKCIIIDDEQWSIDTIMQYINVMPKMDVIGTFTQPRHALECIDSTSDVDLIFMDVDMPHLSGIELGRALRSKTKKLVFTTGHTKYAFEAFEAEGDAYLLKPFSFAKFSTTINRLFNDDNHVRRIETALPVDHFLVKSKEDDLRIVKVKFDELVAFEGFNNYVKIYLTNSKILIAYLTLKDVLDLLGCREEFRQFHRAFIISTNCIRYIEGNTITMQNNLSFTIGEHYKENFSAYLSGRLLKTSRKK